MRVMELWGNTIARNVVRDSSLLFGDRQNGKENKKA